MTIEYRARQLASRFTSTLYDADDLAQDAHLARILHPRQWPRQAMIDGLRRWYGRMGPQLQFRRMVALKDRGYWPDFDGPILCRELLRQLPRQEGAVAYLYYMHGHSEADIAHAMGIGASRVSQIVTAARRRLRRRLLASISPARSSGRTPQSSPHCPSL